MYLSDLIEVAAAVHLSSRVDSPFTDRGGMIVVGPPGALKSTVIMIVAEHYPDALLLSDINAQMLGQIRGALTGGSARTLVLPEMAKLYQRHTATSSNVEGIIQALASEGFASAAWEDQRMAQIRARATVLSAITPQRRQAHFAGWEESGFSRRFLWPLIYLEDPAALEQAVIEWRRLTFGTPALPPLPLSPGERIPANVTHAERKELARWTRGQPGDSHAIQLQIIAKCLAVLRWWYRTAQIDREPMDTLRRFAVSLGKEGAAVALPSQPGPVPVGRPAVRLTTTRAARKLAVSRWDREHRKRKGARPRGKK